MYEDGRAPYTRLKKPRRPKPDSWNRLRALGLHGPEDEELKREIDAARNYRKKEQSRSLLAWMLVAASLYYYFRISLSADQYQQDERVKKILRMLKQQMKNDTGTTGM